MRKVHNMHTSPSCPCLVLPSPYARPLACAAFHDTGKFLLLGSVATACQGDYFLPRPSLSLSPSFCTSSTSSLCFSVRKSGSSGMGGVGHSVELGKFLLSLLECFAFWFFRLPQTCSKPKKGFFRRQFCLFHSLTIFPSVSHMKSCSEILNFSTYRV